MGQRIRYSEKNNHFPARLAIEKAASFRHWLAAGRAWRCHCGMAMSETANGSASLLGRL
jgi:hypothetical protein